MKKLISLSIAALIAAVLTACGNGGNNDTQESGQADTDQTKPQETNTKTNEDQKDTQNDTGSDSTDTMKQQMQKLPYTDYEIEVEYANNKEYEAEIELDQAGNVTSSLKDELNNVRLQGKESFDKLYPAMEKLDIDGNTSKNDAISKTLSALELPKDYRQIEITLETTDGKKIEFEDRK